MVCLPCGRVSLPFRVTLRLPNHDSNIDLILPHRYRLQIIDDGVDAEHTGFWKAFAHAQNYADFFMGLVESFVFLFDACRGKPYTRSKQLDKSGDQIGAALDFNDAFRPHSPSGVKGEEEMEMNYPSAKHGCTDSDVEFGAYDEPHDERDNDYTRYTPVKN